MRVRTICCREGTRSVGTGVRDLRGYVGVGRRSESTLRRSSFRVQVLGYAGDGELCVPEVAGVSGALMAAPARVLASTTSHKREPLLPTLEIFGRLGLQEVDLNLHHILEGGESVSGVTEAVATHGLRLWVLSGGWCDFFKRAPEIEETFTSVARQVSIADALGVRYLRLFFGRLHDRDYSPDAARDHRRQSLAALRRPSPRHVRVREPRRRVAPSGGVRGCARARGAGEHPDELRSHQLRESGRRSDGGAHDRAFTRRPCSPEGPRPWRVLRVRRRRRRPRTGRALARGRGVRRAVHGRIRGSVGRHPAALPQRAARASGRRL